MPPADTLLVFFSAALILALTPGPDNLFVLAQAAQRGYGAGLAVTLGLCTGLLGHTGAVAFGVAALFEASSLAFAIVKYCGALYLLLLAWQVFTAGEHAGAGPIQPLPLSRLYRRGIVMNITNPKVSLFFLAFMPQFVEPLAGPVLPQFLLLGVLFIVSTIIVFGGISLLAGTIGGVFRKSPASRRWLNRLAGSVFVALAVKLAFAERG